MFHFAHERILKRIVHARGSGGYHGFAARRGRPRQRAKRRPDMKDDTAEALANISEALVAAIAEAQARLEIGLLGQEFRDLLRHSRQLHVALLEILLVAEPNVDERTRGRIIAFSNSLDRLEDRLQGDDGEPR